MPFIVHKSTAGKVVKKHIKDAKQELIKDKEKMKEDYK
tara:strand:+ start:462 stop:575 length:114 start_codon:yes stop_codon:yes gene_type:complete